MTSATSASANTRHSLPVRLSDNGPAALIQPPRLPLHAALESARHDVALVYGGAPPTRPEIEQDKACLTGLLRRWVLVWAVWEEEALAVPHVASYVSWQVQAGVQARIVSQSPVTFALVDKRASVVGQDSAPRSGGVGGPVTVSDCPEVTGMMHYLFRSLWEDAAPWVTVGHGLVDEHSQDVLRLLTRGYTNEQIAEHLNVSKRTVSRTVARLMQELNANSRFEAGALAARRGWFQRAGLRP